MPLMLKPFAKYFDFSGRARRAEYWLFYLFQVIVYVCILTVPFVMAGSHTSILSLVTMLIMPLCLFALVCAIPNLAVTVRRLHDTDKSIVWLLLYVPGIANSALNISHVLNKGLTLAALQQQNLAFALIGSGCNLYMLYLMRKSGTVGPNRFGEDPKRLSIDISVFDDPKDEADTNKGPYVPIFDFTSPDAGPGFRTQPVAEPAPPPPPPALRPQPPAPVRPPAFAYPGANSAPAFGKRR